MQGHFFSPYLPSPLGTIIIAHNGRKYKWQNAQTFKDFLCNLTKSQKSARGAGPRAAEYKNPAFGTGGGNQTQGAYAIQLASLRPPLLSRLAGCLWSTDL